ncbi:Predicted acylesterase/phospholipase RssA, contains patatin domain [Cupriavidus sp. YR651]|uniref:patatin-like phospholipase family protein n=1 Tax=Cupriavidus sp. YR651 TaxID=1855315 RepID=UPI0008900486|nr:patatin-like phospholipase family protein [Cupriavidus sp. YR651]SDD93461.1 Predicted acylesterase/phospholipase RssA, contains patatin domain [Cupriavidus sp. YR651]
MGKLFLMSFKDFVANKLKIGSLFLGLFIALILSLQGCSTTPGRLPAVPREVTSNAEIPGMPGVRYAAGADAPELTKAAFDSLKRERDYLAQQGRTGPMPPAVFLAISGGGDNGAFAAGLLNAWTETGTRPEFKLVTGISTGALIAPFVFLGPKYDSTLKQVYTTISSKDVLEQRSFLGGVLSDAMADNRPLLTLTRKFVTEDLLKEIAAEYAKGRMLLVATTDLDARRGIIWDMGKIATYGGPKALDLFIKVLVASTSIPGAFPPMMINVEVNGTPYQEMHVDGGVVAQVFAYPATLRLGEEAVSVGVRRERKLYIIRNARLDADWMQVERSTMGIASRAVASMIQSQGIGDLYRIYATANRDGVDYNLAFIPASFNAPHKEEFDTEYMRALYDAAYKMALKGYPWAKVPPGFALPRAAATKK